MRLCETSNRPPVHFESQRPSQSMPCSSRSLVGSSRINSSGRAFLATSKCNLRCSPGLQASCNRTPEDNPASASSAPLSNLRARRIDSDALPSSWGTKQGAVCKTTSGRSTSPANIFNSVVLPTPLRPIIAT